MVSTVEKSRFDWYQGSFPEGNRTGAVDVLGPLGDESPLLVKGQNGYDRGWQIRREGSKLCTVYEGHGRADHFVVTGSDSPEVARRVRRLVPGHRVSRADVCIDFDAGASFFGETRALITDRLLGTVTLTDYVERGIAGQAATLYVGAKTSATRLRLYEKGKEDSDYPADTVRLELQARPTKERKALAAELTPDGYWGLAGWSRWIAEAVCAVAAPAAPPRSARVSDRERALDAAARQYGRRYLETLMLHGGDLAAFGADLISRVPDAWLAEVGLAGGDSDGES